MVALDVEFPDSPHDPETTFDELYRSTFPATYRLVYARLRGGPDVADVIQDTYSAVFRALPAALAAHSPQAFVIAIALRRLSDYRRARARLARSITRMIQASPPTPQPSPTEIRVLAVLDGLTRDHQEVLLLKYVVGMSVDDISLIIDRSSKGTEALLSRARRALKDLLEVTP